jgi:hypothetical protein
MSAYSREFYQKTYGKLSYSKVLGAGESGTLDNVIPVRNANWTIYVQAIMFTPTTGVAQTLTFQDDAGTPVPIAKTVASPTQGESYIFDFGPEGVPLTAGKNLDIAISAAGLAGSIHIEGYQKLSSVVAATSA